MSGCNIEKQIEAFATGFDSEYAFPANLSVEERKLVKSAAEKFGLSTKSFGMGGERKIHVFKAVKYSVKNTFVDGPVDPAESAATILGPAHQSMPAGGLQAHIAAEEMTVPSEQTSALVDKLSTKGNKEQETPLNSQSGGSTADSDSDVQEPTISIKNSFVHFEGDSDESGDPRIVQSMPDSKFAEHLRAEKWEAKNAVDQKSRPLPVSQDPDPEVEAVAAMEIPSTPNAETSFGTVPFSSVTACPAMEHPPASFPVAQWPQNIAPQDPSVTVLPPASWAPQTPFATPQDPSVTVLQPACWAQGAHPMFPPGPPSLMPTLEESAPSSFVPGTAVVLCGLASQPAFNGLRGTVSSYDADCGRYNIVVDAGPNAARKMVKVKFQNLVLAQPVVSAPPPVMPPYQSCYLSGQHPGYSHSLQAPLPVAPPPVAPPPVKATLTLDAMI
eukprot:gnl/MRDRNA2_/MRDRNA2_93720_c0_seq1.p1 gnl/MRDRNA2_/MRDRNA2_93720_c0~~gnl/MRDRNA2_/MRDRNA2_93720_c0_seq1.p1  ORF type:complete len:443 (+),score=106.49 gnl/MRDRNA2_/MRDRNA2_93720_c0_seq1:82-1410(+)